MINYKLDAMEDLYKDKTGIVYLARFTINNIPFLKIGYTTQTVENRMNYIMDEQEKFTGIKLEIEILDSFDCIYPRLMEMAIQKNLHWLRANMPKVCSGFTELYSATHPDVERYFQAASKSMHTTPRKRSGVVDKRQVAF